MSFEQCSTSRPTTARQFPRAVLFDLWESHRVGLAVASRFARTQYEHLDTWFALGCEFSHDRRPPAAAVHGHQPVSADVGRQRHAIRRTPEGARLDIERDDFRPGGVECERWLPLLSAIVDGEATPEQLLEIRPHLRNCTACRATVRELHATSAPLAALFPVALAPAAADHGHERAAGLVVRLYEAIAGGIHDRAASAELKLQGAAEALSGGKLAAIAASSNPHCQLWLFVEFKSFANSPVRNPCPTYLQAKHSGLNSYGHGAATCFMWEQPVVDAYVAMMKAAAARYDTNAHVEGLILQESSLGFNDGYAGRAPDLGAVELGSAPPHYGPRPEK
jgi:hypothetical protein